MSVLDRVRRSTPQTGMAPNGDQKSADQSTIPEGSEVAKRIHLVATELIQFAQSKSDSPFASHMWVIKSLFQIFFEEMNTTDDAKLGMWIDQFGCLLTWCGTGDDSVLPEEVRDFLHREHPEMLAIEA